jgi:hypothetical protein
MPDLNLKSPESVDVRESIAFGLLNQRNKDVLAIRYSLQRLAAEVRLPTILALARSRHPDRPIADAVHLLAGEIGQIFGKLIGHVEEFDLAEKTERERVAPYLLNATHRLFAASDEREKLTRQIARADAERAERTKRLGAAGLSSEEIQLNAPPVDKAALEAEIETLDEEIIALEHFIRLKDERYLPEGFVERWMRDDSLDAEAA